MKMRALTDKETHPASREGLRARKVRETRDRIAECAIDLFLKLGIDDTTVDAIAEAAGISRRTFFHYYDSKVAVLTAAEESMADEFVREAMLLPDGLTPLAAAEMVLLTIIERWFRSPEAILVDELMRSTEDMRARRQAIYQVREQALAEALRRRYSDKGDSYPLLVAAVTAVGAFRIAVDQWSNMPDGPLMEVHFTRAMITIRQEIDDISTKYEKL
jgi:AcrR family transcriptional regulator